MQNWLPESEFINIVKTGNFPTSIIYQLPTQGCIISAYEKYSGNFLSIVTENAKD